MVVVLVGSELEGATALARALSRALNATVVDGRAGPEDERLAAALRHALATPRRRPHVIVLCESRPDHRSWALEEHGPLLLVSRRIDGEMLVVTAADDTGGTLAVDGSGDAEAVATRLMGALLRRAHHGVPLGHPAPSA